MKCLILLTAGLFLFYSNVFSQEKNTYQIDLRGGSITPSDGVNERSFRTLNESVRRGPALALLQFYESPSEQQKTDLGRQGIHFLNYAGGKAYIVQLDKALEPAFINESRIRALLPFENERKISSTLLTSSSNKPVVHTSLFATTTIEDAIALLNEKGFDAKKTSSYYPVLEMTVSKDRLPELASFYFIEFIDVPPPPPVELNDKSEATTRANILQSPDYGLTGEGVVMQISEISGFPQGHLDFINHSLFGQTQNYSNYHATHVTGIAAGQGLLDERFKGYAPGSRFISSSSGLLSDVNVVNYNIDLTNHSYGGGVGCTRGGTLNYSNSISLEKMALDFPHLLHIYAAGNYGTSQCTLYPAGYNTIDLNNQTSKAVLTVGSVEPSGELAGYSSRGPAYSARLKPEIVAPGSQIWSTVPDNFYSINNGTSMASPAAMGALALLYQRYMQLHNGTKPDNGLMKALLCNTATDKGNIGPDYSYGFGLMNLNRAIQTLNAGNYYTDKAVQNAARTKSIPVPKGTAQLKVMLYWNDRPGTPLTTRYLVNDLDLQVQTPTGTTVLPYILDTIPALVANPATRGEDHVNNIEQVVIDHPQAGTYTLSINGQGINEGEEQPYYIVYDVVPDSIQITYPGTGQALNPGETIIIQWDSWGHEASTFKLEFSTDNGTTWQLADAAIPAGSTRYNWTVPQTATAKARFRLTRNDDLIVSVSGAFKIIGVPVIKLSSAQCAGSITIDWDPVNGATDYEVMRYVDGNMVPVATTALTHFRLTGLSEDSTYWVTVRSRYNGVSGRRAPALSRKPDSGVCSDPAEDGDLKMAQLVAPTSGRRFTSSGLGKDTIVVRVKNLDDAPSSGFTIAYSVNGGAWVTQPIATPLPANASDIYKLATPYDFTQAGTYVIRVAVHGINDPYPANDTLTVTIRHLLNEPVDPSTGIMDDIENGSVRDYKNPVSGLEGLDRFDYYNNANTHTESLRVGSHYTLDSTKALELTVFTVSFDNLFPQELMATYNLSRFDTSLHDVRLDFNYITISPGSSDSLWIRSNEQSPWMYMCDMTKNQTTAGNKEWKGIAIGDTLKAYHQNYSSSLQVKWARASGYNTTLVDNIQLYNASADIAMISIDSLKQNNCGLSMTPIQVTIDNRSTKPAASATLKYQVDNEPVVSETVTQIAPKALLSYRFRQLANLSAPGLHTIKAWVEYAGDSYPGNNSTQLFIHNLPFVKNYPALEDFEHGSNGWYTDGTNSSWQFGKPASTLINSAASGNYCWKTNLTGNYNSSELSFLYAGCYDLSQLKRPVISISAALNTDSTSSVASRDVATIQYSIDGVVWRGLPFQSIYNWPVSLTSFWYNRWHVMSARLSDTLKTVQLRFAFRSNGVINYEGVALDDLHVYDSTAIYEGISNSVSQTISGGQQWIDFQKDGKIIAAVQPHNQDLGTVSIQSFLNSDKVRHFQGQYYLDRNFVLQATNPLTDSITVRLYFTDKESDSLLFAKNCPSCTRITNAYRYGVNIYTSKSAIAADSSIQNDKAGVWQFIDNKKVTTVPFMNGYYIEFTTKDLGEIRLSNGGLDAKSFLPVVVRNMSAQKTSTGVQLKWTTTSEINIDHFEIEVASGNDAYQQDQFIKVGEVKSGGRSATEQYYQFTDQATDTATVRYYRIKSVDVYGNYSYSEDIPVFFSDELTWQVFPNPSTNKFNLLYQAPAGSKWNVSLYAASGQEVKTLSVTANGYIQKTDLGLDGSLLAAGVYLLRITDGVSVKELRLVKQ